MSVGYKTALICCCAVRNGCFLAVYISQVDPQPISLIYNNTIDFSSKYQNDKLRAKKIGIIYQDNNLLTDFTVMENIGDLHTAYSFTVLCIVFHLL